MRLFDVHRTIFEPASVDADGTRGRSLLDGAEGGETLTECHGVTATLCDSLVTDGYDEIRGLDEERHGYVAPEITTATRRTARTRTAATSSRPEHTPSKATPSPASPNSGTRWSAGTSRASVGSGAGGPGLTGPNRYSFRSRRRYLRQNLSHT